MVARAPVVTVTLPAPYVRALMPSAPPETFPVWLTVTLFAFAVSRFSAMMPLNAAPPPVTFAEPVTRTLPTPVALSSAKMPRCVMPVTGPLVVTDMLPTPFWRTKMPIASPEMVPVRPIVRLVGLAEVPKLEVRSSASPLVVVILPAPEMLTAPFAMEEACTVWLVGPPRTRLPPVPLNSMNSFGEAEESAPDGECSAVGDIECAAIEQV